jgi:macrophage erythroblast attacher
VPYEILNKKFRAAQKQLDREVSHVQAATGELEKGLKTTNVDVEEISRILGGMVERLQVLKRKASSRQFFVNFNI